MTKEEAYQLKPGDVIRDISTDKVMVLTEFTMTEFNDRPLLHVKRETEPPSENVWWIPYFLDEIELISETMRKCTCPLDVIMVRGCICGGC